MIKCFDLIVKDAKFYLAESVLSLFICDKLWADYTFYYENFVVNPRLCSSYRRK